MTALVLHLSDIHIKTATDPILKRAEDIARCLFSRLPTATRVFLIVSGDIAFSGQREEFDAASRFLRVITAAIVAEKDLPVAIILAPGNHDCDFSRSTVTRNTIVSQLVGGALQEIDESVIQTCTRVQDAFFSFRKGLENAEDVVDDGLRRVTRFEVEGRVLAVDCLNVSWVSQLAETPGRLYFPVDRYSDKLDPDIDVRLVVMHQPFNWFAQPGYRKFREFVRKQATILFTGHEHEGNVGINFDAETKLSAYVEGCVLQGEQDLSDSSFNVVVLDLEEGKFSATQYVWQGDRYRESGEGSWNDYHELPVKRDNPFPVAPEFSQRLEDPGPFLKHPRGHGVTLSDIFVYPDLKRVGADERQQVHENSQRLLNPQMLEQGVLIEAAEKSGASSLLHQLFLGYYARGYVPVLLDGRDLKSFRDKDVAATVLSAVASQYGQERLSTFEQLSRTKKVLLVDGFDLSPMSAAVARSKLLQSLQRRFAYVAMSVGEMFEMKDVFASEGANGLTAFLHFQLQDFGFRLRAQLARKWFSLGNDGTMDNATLLARCDEAERVMNTVMARRIIPSVPLYLLTLLQSVAAGRTGDFKESALGYYYQYLLTDALEEAGVQRHRFTEMFDYACQLAWFFHTKGRRELEEAELRKFNEEFSTEWHTVDFIPRLNILLKAKVLYRSGQSYAFRYPYIYYFLKGLYLKKSLGNKTVREYVERCCRHLYVREHANTVLFLAHHTSEEFVLQTIAQALRSMFAKDAPVLFEGDDTKGVQRLIEGAPRLKYRGGTPEANRERVQKFQDEVDDGSDGLAETEEESQGLSLPAQLMTLVKTMEILGQVLKNQYSGIPRERRRALVEEIMVGPLRGLGNFYAYLNRTPDWLVAEIDAALERRGKVDDAEERKRIAKRLVGAIIQIISLSFIVRASDAVNSDRLLEDIRDVVERRGALAFRLMEMSVLLDSPKTLPRHKLGALLEEVNTQPIAARLLNLMLLNRLYMFETSEADMQWLAKESGLRLDLQHAISYGAGRNQRLAQPSGGNKGRTPPSRKRRQP